MVAKKKKTKKSPPVELSRLNKKKIWVFRIISIVFIPSLLFGGLELGLRIFNAGYPTEAVIERQIGGKPMYCHNPQFGWRFFPKQIAREFDGGFVFDKTKSPKTYRIFVLGASAAMGEPAAMYSFGRILEVMLRDMYPEIEFEVHTAAMVAINSHVVVEIAKDCAEYDPDLFIVYLGNNEVVGPFGPGTVLTSAPLNLSLIRANIAVKSTRTIQFLEEVLRSFVPRSKTPQLWRGMAMFLEKQVRHNSAALESVYSHFEKNLQDICNIACRSGASVIISNVGVNLKDSPPFASLHKDGLTESEKQAWEKIYQKGADDEADGRYTQAIESYLAAAEIDETFADLQFRLGRNYWRIGDYETARQHYLKALQYDTLRFRADARINKTIRSVADRREEEGIYFVDSIAAFEDNSPYETPGEELFYEHVHFNFKGNYILAKAFFMQLQKILPASPKQRPDAVLSEEQCAEWLAYTGLERHYSLSNIYHNMQGQPPFTNQLYYEETMAKIVQQMEELAECTQPSNLKETASQLRNALQETPDDWRLLLWQYTVLFGKGGKDLQAEEVHLKKVIDLCPYYPAYFTLGQNLQQQGRIREAQDILYQLLEIKPNSAKVYFELATLARKLGNNQRAIRHVKQAIKVEPTTSIIPYEFLAETYEKARKTDKAIRTLYEAIEIFPEKQTSQAHSYLGHLLYSQGKYKMAQEEMDTALKINQAGKEK